MTLKSVDELATSDIAINRSGAVASIVLKRVRALNALTTAMRAEIAIALPAMARDASLYAVVLRSESPRAFSAGGDVRELVQWNASDPSRARAAFADEYRLNWALDCFSKPSISLIDGMVMGSGVGISIYNTHRVAGEGYQFAMPETAIGLFPDVGAAFHLARLGGEIGTYLGLTGRSIGRADAYHLGLATHCIAAERFGEIEAALGDARPVDDLLDGLNQEPGEGALAPHAEMIAACFSAPTVEEIMARLAAWQGSDRDFAAGISSDLAKRSPVSLKITLRHLRQAAGLDLKAVLETDFRLAWRALAGDDFAEGVRAALIDKDNLPVWRPTRIEDVSDAMVAAYFAPLGPGQDLVLASREEMQASRY